MPDRVALGAYYMGAIMVPFLVILTICQVIEKTIELYHKVKNIKI